MALRSLLRLRQPSSDGRVDFFCQTLNLCELCRFWVKPGPIFQYQFGILCFLSAYVCVCIVLMFVSSDSFVTQFFCIPWNKTGGGEDDMGSHLKYLYIYSPGSFWLSAIRRLMGYICGCSSTSVSSKYGCLWPLVKEFTWGGIWLKIRFWALPQMGWVRD